MQQLTHVSKSWCICCWIWSVVNRGKWTSELESEGFLHIGIYGGVVQNKSCIVCQQMTSYLNDKSDWPGCYRLLFDVHTNIGRVCVQLKSSIYWRIPRQIPLWWGNFMELFRSLFPEGLMKQGSLGMYHDPMLIFRFVWYEYHKYWGSRFSRNAYSLVHDENIKINLCSQE